MDDNKRGLQRFFRWARPRDGAQAIDAADMGTAYGMELSLDASQEAEDEARAATARVQARAPQPPEPK